MLTALTDEPRCYGRFEDDLRWKTTIGGRRLSVDDDLRWKTTFGGRRPSMEDEFWWKTILACCLVRFAAFFQYRLTHYFPTELPVTKHRLITRLLELS